MKVYFTNDSKQRKILLETDYIEDAYDTIYSFFEEHNKYPHFLEIQLDNNIAKITFGSVTEFFFIDHVTQEDFVVLEEMIKEYNEN